MANSVPVVDLGKKRKHESSNDAVSKLSCCESDSDSDFACEAPESENTSTASGERLHSGIQPFTYLKSSSGVYLSSIREASSDRAAQKSLATNHASASSNRAPEASANDSESDSEGEEAAQVEEVEPAVSSASVTLSSDITKPAPSTGLTSSLKTGFSAVKVSYPLYQSNLLNTNSELARIRNLGNDSNVQQNSTTKYAPFHPLHSFPSQLSHQFNPTLPPPALTQPGLPPPPPPPSVRTQPPPFNFYIPSPSPFPPFQPFFPPFLNLPPPFPHPPFPPPPTPNSMPYSSPPPR